MKFSFIKYIKTLVVLITIAFTFQNAKAQSNRALGMDIKFSSAVHAAGSKIKLYREWPKRTLIDTSSLDNQHAYTFHLTDSVPAVYTLQCRKPFVNQVIMFEKGMCTITFSADSQIVVSGGKLQTILDKYLAEMEPMQKQWTATGNKYMKAANLEEKLIAAKENDIQEAKVETARLNFIHNNINNAAGEWIAYSNLNLFNLRDLKKIDAYFLPTKSTNHVSGMIGQKLQAQVLQHTLFVGKMAPSFTLQSKEGNPIAIDSIFKRHKYVLIDVWASWCTPCRAANRNLVPVYASLKSKGIELVSVSVDDAKEAWKKAIDADKIPWMQLIADHGMKGTFATQYQIKSLPSTFLVDKNGIIIKQNATIADLEKL